MSGRVDEVSAVDVSANEGVYSLKVKFCWMLWPENRSKQFFFASFKNLFRPFRGHHSKHTGQGIYNVVYIIYSKKNYATCSGVARWGACVHLQTTKLSRDSNSLGL